MPLRVNTKQLRELIEEIEAGGGNASVLRQELEELGPDHDSRPRAPGRGSRFRDDEEPTTAERLNHRVGDLFDGGVSDGLVEELVEMDRNHSLKELKCLCVENGLSAGGDKKELCAKLVAKGVLGTKMPQTTVPWGRCYEDAWRFVIREGEGELVHGTVQTIGKRIGHAWVETKSGDILEPESGELMKKDFFYERAQPKVEARYNAEEAAIMVARTNNFGPWTKEDEHRFIER